VFVALWWMAYVEKDAVLGLCAGVAGSALERG
jgi:hypothetical protein